MNVYRLYNLDNYLTHVDKNHQSFLYRQSFEASLSKSQQLKFSVPGISYPANKYVDFHVDYNYSNTNQINWRERLVCPITNLNNRLRCSIHLIDYELGIYPESQVYITEQVTPMFNFLSHKYKNLMGSEYLGDGLEPGTYANNIRHEDMTNLSFQDDFFDHYLSFECFEHIPSFKVAVKEAARVLKKNGSFFGSFPFDLNSANNIVRAYVNNTGETIHLLEPEYHGDPVNEQGILCYTVFGWEFLDQFRSAGFRDVYVMLVWSDVFGYLGGEQIFVVAKK